MEKNGATVTANPYTIDFYGVQINFGFKSVTVELDGNIKEYSADSLQIINGKSVIDSQILKEDFNLTNSQATHQEGDRFSSEQDAVLAFSLKYHQKSKKERQEYDAAINVDENGKYYFSNVVSSAGRYRKKPNALTYEERLPTTYNVGNIGNIHTHWDTSQSLGFSSQDNTNMIMNYHKINKSRSNYVVSPYGKVYFAKSSGKIETPKSYYLFKVGG